MATYEKFREDVFGMNERVVQMLKDFEASLQQRDEEYFRCIQNDIKTFHSTGVLTPSFDNQDVRTTVEPPESTKTRGRPKKRTEALLREPSNNSDSSKENNPEVNKEPPSTGKRPKRNAFLEATQVINQQVSQPLNTKLRQPSDQRGTLRELVVKVERLTDYGSGPSEFVEPKNDELQLKKETDDMPPPSRPPLRQNQRTKSKQSKNVNADDVQIKLEPLSENNRKRRGASKILSSIGESSERIRDSDIQIHSEPVDTIVLNDTIVEAEKPSKTRGRTKNKRKLENKQQDSNGDETEVENKKRREEKESDSTEETVRVTRTKTRAAKNKDKETEKQSQSDSTTEDENTKANKPQSGRTKTKKKKVIENNNTSEFEDAVSDVEKTSHRSAKSKPVMNETIVITKPAVLNETVVIEKPNHVLMNETRTINAAPNTNNQAIDDALMTDDEDVVSSSPVVTKSKKIKPVFSPYEERPVKKRVQAFEKLYAESGSDIPSKIPCISAIKTVAKIPNEKQKSPTESQTVSNSYITPLKSQSHLHHNLSTSVANSTFLSELKASQSESRARQLRQKQKENEVLRKQEAVMQALTEERKRRREERQLKAQQARDAMEREKQKLLDSAAKAKEEKLKKVLTEKEEKLQKQREQAALKRAQAMKKAADEKLKEDKRREEQKIYEKQQSNGKIIPPYLKYETPLLPTADCYDSDDEKAVKQIYVRSWEKKPALLSVLQQMRFVHTLKNQLFFNCPRTVNLREIFPTIESHKLKRTSSAIWDRSGMSKLDTLSEED